MHPLLENLELNAPLQEDKQSNASPPRKQGSLNAYPPRKPTVKCIPSQKTKLNASPPRKQTVFYYMLVFMEYCVYDDVIKALP